MEATHSFETSRTPYQETQHHNTEGTFSVGSARKVHKSTTFYQSQLSSWEQKQNKFPKICVLFGTSDNGRSPETN